jgi:hypothetical protein
MSTARRWLRPRWNCSELSAGAGFNIRISSNAFQGAFAIGLLLAGRFINRSGTRAVYASDAGSLAAMAAPSAASPGGGSGLDYSNVAGVSIRPAKRPC